jgi:predicted metal-dependent phosphoesterase TrpH
LLIDFHCHTTASDGHLSPRDLIERAIASNIAQFAITDHDTMLGYREAAEHYTQIPGKMRLIPGVELSCRWSGTTIHVVGLDVDGDHPVLAAGLQQMTEARQARGKKIADRLESKGFAGAWEGGSRHAGKSQLGRPHFAQWLIEQGHVAGFSQAFDRYLGQGKIGDVKAFWPELAEVVGWIAQSGGVAILAHPLKYRFTRMKLRRLVVDFKAAGGTAIETLSGRQTSDQTRQLQRMAIEFDLEASVGSDFHKDGLYNAPLGVEAPKLTELRGVWQRWSQLQQEEVGT